MVEGAWRSGPGDQRARAMAGLESLQKVPRGHPPSAGVQQRQHEKLSGPAVPRRIWAITLLIIIAAGRCYMDASTGMKEKSPFVFTSAIVSQRNVLAHGQASRAAAHAAASAPQEPFTAETAGVGGGGASSPPAVEMALQAYASAHWGASVPDLRRDFSKESARRALVLLFREGRWGVADPGQLPRRDGGVADRMTGIITQFVAALATNTTFFLDWPALGRYYRPRFSFGTTDTESHVAQELLRPPLLQQFVFQQLKGGQLLQSAATRPVTVVRAGFGALHCFWHLDAPTRLRGCQSVQQQVKKDALLQPGRQLPKLIASVAFPDAFREMFNFLLEPTALLKSALPNVSQRVLAPVGNTTNLRKVMLQIRIGDQAISQQGSRSYAAQIPASLRLAQQFFDCALQHYPRASTAVWFVMTDSEAVKRYSLEKYPELVVVNSYYGSGVTGAPAQNRDGYKPTKRASDDPLMHVLAEQWIGTHCDVFVVTKNSGLGRQASFRSSHPDRVLYYGDDKCKRVPWAEAAHDWSSI